ncbi:DNA/RNA polymerase [Lactarius akahatsu]|uniref:DNA-directed RNA polymerase n=1 Tax=Lactarius akahatsu TaxID=416441 RepID=A0AAD4L6I4_9AGAM|nr:DNA/RNA polymerase [Lactarius akahatsu]
MIPFTTRVARKQMETTLLSCSRQRLPRPARLYSTPTKRSSAPVMETLIPDSYPAFLPALPNHADPSSNVQDDTTTNDMHSFLRTRTPYMVLPPPLPCGKHSELNDLYYTDSPTRDLIAVMDACLHNCHDVHRAKEIFDNLRAKSAEQFLHPRLYTAFVEAYLEMALKEPEKKSLWVEDAWILLDSLFSGQEKVAVTTGAYALALITWLRYSSENAPSYIDGVTNHTPASLLKGIVDNQLSVVTVVSDRAIKSSEEAQNIIRALTGAAIQHNYPEIIRELGHAESMGSSLPDPYLDVPEVRPVTVNASVLNEDGMSSGKTETEIPFNLDVLRKHLAHVSLARRVLSEDLAARQKLLEDSVYDVAVQRMRRQAELFKELGLGDSVLRKQDLQLWMWQWHQLLQARLKEDIALLIEKETASLTGNPRNRAQPLGPFLSLVKPEKLSLITILEVMHLQGTGGVANGMKAARGLVGVGKAIELEYKAQMCKKNNISMPSTARVGESGFFSRYSYNNLHARRVTARKYMEDAEEWTGDWTQSLRVRVGSFLVDRLMDVAKVIRTGLNKRTGDTVEEEQPAFTHSYEYLRGYKLGIIKLNPVVAERMAKDSIRDTMHPRHLPMLVKPKPWLNYNEGGYIYNKNQVMRFKDSQEQQQYLKHASSRGNVELVYAGLDVLGSTPWQINRKIFDVVLEVWNAGYRLGKVPPAVYDEPEPEKTPEMETDQKARSIFIQRQRRWLANKANNHSDRCSVNYKIEIARAFLGDTFYLPHNLDFRGRAYPLPPHLNHIGDDLSRGLLLFGEAKPLGERGLRWLKIHLSNLYGYDKATFDERAEFVQKNLEDIYDSAENPLNGRKWWQKADDPWQCLATCMELKAALDSPDPLAYECSLPVHQDGTCNGLQHYAALGGDARGARQVNLDITDRPSDVYTYVANMVEKRMREDLEQNPENKYAKMLVGKIARKVVKQTVMTTVYGVTFVGAREQIERQLKDRGDVPLEDCYLAAAYLAKQVLQCIGDLFQGANDIMNWLTACARIISKSVPGDRVFEAMELDHASKSKKVKGTTTRLRKEQMAAVVWTTPLGLPIVQPYRKVKRKQVMTSMQSVYISDPNAPAEVNSQKQASAFPPNFIHSLDATHMLLTALECRTQDLMFASVHDSYWTHPSSIDQMSTIIRDTFIALHSSDVLSRLLNEFRERYKGYKVPVASLKTSQILKQLGIVDTATNISSRRPKNTIEAVLEPATETTDAAIQTAEEDEEPAEIIERPPTVSVLSKEQAVMLLKPVCGQAKRSNNASSATTQDGQPATEDSLEGKFVDLVDLLPPVPAKGEFDVNKIKSSLYFFS